MKKVLSLLVALVFMSGMAFRLELPAVPATVSISH